MSWLAYLFVRCLKEKSKFKGNTQKILSLSGYTSGLLLLIFALGIIVETIQRLINQLEITYKEAIFVAIIGLIVNIISAFLLHHEQEDSDHNIRAAYLHVIADAVTSLSAIIGLTVAMIWNIVFVDTIAAVISSMIIINWSISLLRDSGKVLLDVRP